MNAPLPQHKPSQNPDGSLLEKGTDLFGTLFGGGLPTGGVSASSSATSAPIYANSSLGGDFTVTGQGGSIGKPFLTSTAIVTLSLIGAGLWLAGRR